MRSAFLIGWLLMLGAFAAAAAETIARALPGGTGWVMSASELWQGLWPGSFVMASVRLGEMAPQLWDPVITGFLTLPAWALLGIPGIALAWTCRPNRELSPQQEEELREHEASLFLYDELAREARKWAREEGDDPNLDDRLPGQDVIDLFEGRDDDDDYLEDPDPLPEFVTRRD